MANNSENTSRNAWLIAFICSVLLLLPVQLIAAKDTLLPSVDEVANLLSSNPKAIIVDVRRADQFSELRIPASINIPLHFIKSKSFLQGMKVILVNEGYDLNPLLQEAAELQKNNITASVMAGGLAAWHQQGKPLAGDPFTGKSIHLMPAKSLLAAEGLSAVGALIDISTEALPEAANYLPNLLHLPLRSAEDLNTLVSHINNLQLAAHQAVLVLNNDGDYTLAASLMARCTATIFYLENGLVNGYLKTTQEHAAMIAPREQRLQTTGVCATCPDAEETDE